MEDHNKTTHKFGLYRFLSSDLSIYCLNVAVRQHNKFFQLIIVGYKRNGGVVNDVSEKLGRSKEK